jgi:hypothetical protein
VAETDYPACSETYVTLRVYLGETDPDFVTETVGVAPSSTQRAGDRHGRTFIRINGWFLTSQNALASTDSRKHLEWLLDRLEGRASALRELREHGATMDIACFWVSANANGGPLLPAPLLRRLADLEIDVWFDIYFDEGESGTGASV